ncbi:hypothetical protein B0T20DRAFT_26734 [Sordaria brevicollis]|uniref:Uncharacterized protein n=1 Tax=Sordaria brevicollis TaxID=83679 RepID=A0AAE0PQ44_SORBR|nr:hypothetical protein B0T20DRAFT_26734 [Sordaria brevicollis]
MFDPNYSMDGKGKQPAAAASASPSTSTPSASASVSDNNTRDGDLHIAPTDDADDVLARAIRNPERRPGYFAESPHYDPNRTYVRRHHIPRRRHRAPSHHKIQKRPSLTTTPSAPSTSTATATRSISTTSTASAPAASTSATAWGAGRDPNTLPPHFNPAWLIPPDDLITEIPGPIPDVAPRHLSPNARAILNKEAQLLMYQEEQRRQQKEREEQARKQEKEQREQSQQEQQQQEQPQEQQQQQPLSPPTAMSLVPDTAATSTSTADLQSWAEVGSLEVDDGIEMDDAIDLDDADIKSLLPPSYSASSITPSTPNITFSSSSANTSETRRQRPEKKQLKYNAQTQSRSIQALVEDMIETGTQCNVRSAPPLPAPSAPVLSSLDDLKVDHGFDFASMELEVDERYRDGTVDVLEEERALLESIQVRRAGNVPAGIRKHTVEGTLPLRYQLSAEAAMRCATVVRSRPRMRRRKEHGTGSVTSSVAYSTHSSPMAQPVLPAEQLPSQHFPAIPSSSYRTPP